MLRTLEKLVCCLSIATSIMPHAVRAFYTIPMHPHAGVFRKDNLVRSLLLDDKAWIPKSVTPESKEQYSVGVSNCQSDDAKALFQQAWALQTTGQDVPTREILVAKFSSMLYEAALKLDPQLARQTSMTMWSEAWGLENIRGYPGMVIQQSSCLFRRRYKNSFSQTGNP